MGSIFLVGWTSCADQHPGTKRFSGRLDHFSERAEFNCARGCRGGVHVCGCATNGEMRESRRGSTYGLGLFGRETGATPNVAPSNGQSRKFAVERSVHGERSTAEASAFSTRD